MDKDKVAEILVQIGTLLELKGENPFKTRAYSNAARAIEGIAEPLAKVVAEARLGEIKGIGNGIAKKIKELVETGKLGYYDELKASLPPGLLAMLDIPGLGPKKIQTLNKKLGIDSAEKLEQACTDGKVAELDGFGEKTKVSCGTELNIRKACLRSFPLRRVIWVGRNRSRCWRNWSRPRFPIERRIYGQNQSSIFRRLRVRRDSL